MKILSLFQTSFVRICLVIIVISLLFFGCKKQGPPTNVWFTLDLNNSTNGSLLILGGYVYNSNIIIMRIDNPNTSSSFAALYELCPNDGSTLTYNETLSPPPGFIVCPKCGRRFYVNGNLAWGSSTSAVTSYNVALSGTTLTVSSK